MLSNKARYAIKAVLSLAAEYGNGPVLIGDLARRERIPRKFLELILLELKAAGLLQSKKGRGGGYFLKFPPEQIAIGQVIRVIDGPLAWVPCASATATQPCAECTDVETCSLRLVMRQVRDATAEVLDNKSLAEMLEDSRQAAARKSRVIDFVI